MSSLKIAVPNKGRLSEKIYDLLNRAGLKFSERGERTLWVETPDKEYSIIFVRTQDIPKFVEDEVADIGFTGYDILCESQTSIDKIMDLDFGNCEMVVAVKNEDAYNCSQDLPESFKVATSFPNIAKDYFQKLGKTVKVIEVTGATEITPRLGLSDVVVDITSSGSTLKANNLKVIDKILKSSAIIVARRNLDTDQKVKTDSLLRAISSVIDAEQKKYLMAHVPKKSLAEIKSFLPGLSAPTVTTLLDDTENVVIHVVIDKNKIYESIEHLKSIGGKGILIMTVDQMVR